LILVFKNILLSLLFIK